MTPEVSAVTWLATQPDVDRMADWGSVTVHETDTSDTYQPAFPSVPPTTGSMLGGLESDSSRIVYVLSTVAVLPAASRTVTENDRTPATEVSITTPSGKVPSQDVTPEVASLQA